MKKSKTKSLFSDIADRDFHDAANTKLNVSFEYIDWETDRFFFHGLEKKYYIKFYECINTIRGSTEEQIVQRNHPSLYPKPIFNSNTSTQSSFPSSVISKLAHKLYVELKDHKAARAEAKLRTETKAFEVRVTKNMGRLHGFVSDKTFYVVWFDPAHNLYNQGKGIRTQSEFATVKCFSIDEFQRLVTERDNLQKKLSDVQSENDSLIEMLDNKTAPST